MIDKSIYRVAGIFVACLLLSPVICAQNSTTSDLGEEVDKHLERYLTTGNFSGSILIAREDEVLLERAYGLSNVESGEPNSTGSVFHLASVSRVFTSVGMLLLIQDGMAKLNDPVSKHLPKFPNGDRITIEHLLTLSAGFPNINGLEGYHIWSLQPQTPEKLVSYFKDLPLKFDPGTQTEHSNSNYNVLALLIERLSGMSYGDFLEERIFAPLSMDHSGHRGDPSASIPGMTSGHTPAGIADLVKARGLDWSVKTGNGSLYSTIGDIYKFDRALVKGDLVNQELLALAFTEHFENKGYGWFIRERYDDREIYINGRSPGYGSYFGRLEHQDLTVVVLGNIYNSLPTDIARACMGIALGREVEPPVFHSDRLAPDVLKRITGSYQFGDDFYAPNMVYKLTVSDGHLLANGDWLMPVEGLSFVHRIYSSQIEFVLGEDGEVKYADWDGFKGIPIRQ